MSASSFCAAGRAVRKHLQVDAGLVHLLEPQLAEVLQPLLDAEIRLPSRPPKCVSNSASQ